jgi:hypothetical protein
MNRNCDGNAEFSTLRELTVLIRYIVEYDNQGRSRRKIARPESFMGLAFTMSSAIGLEQTVEMIKTRVPRVRWPV